MMSRTAAIASRAGILAAALALAAIGSAQAAPLAPPIGIAEPSESGIISAQYGGGRHGGYDGHQHGRHHHGGWGGHHLGWGHGHHGWGHRHHDGGHRHGGHRGHDRD
ncbi:hypothetical protein [uncultured Methylobacterium sp.]|uniref:hypothetical protein n=1 Tax=uncultured Methylobacterium sp. TaxID=157278 RepID=UPI0035CAE67C